jgi:hypothetical protein
VELKRILSETMKVLSETMKVLSETFCNTINITGIVSRDLMRKKMRPADGFIG